MNDKPKYRQRYVIVSVIHFFFYIVNAKWQMTWNLLLTPFARSIHVAFKNCALFFVANFKVKQITVKRGMTQLSAPTRPAQLPRTMPDSAKSWRPTQQLADFTGVDELLNLDRTIRIAVISRYMQFHVQFFARPGQHRFEWLRDRFCV